MLNWLNGSFAPKRPFPQSWFLTQTKQVPDRFGEPTAELLNRFIASLRPILVHSFGEPCWIFARSTHPFWRGAA
jgi:hypothetical protein